MLDPKLLRENIEQVAERLTLRGFTLDINTYHQLEEQRKVLQKQTEALQHQRNAQAKAIGQAKARGEDIAPLLKKTEEFSKQLDSTKAEFDRLHGKLQDFQLAIPNILHDSVPAGGSAAENVEVRRWGEPKSFTFTPQEHQELGEQLQLMDFTHSAKVAGARFVIMHGALARLHRALIDFMLDVHTQDHGYQEIYVPYLVNAASLFGTGQLPKLAGDQFKVDGEPVLYLVPTAEVPVTNTVRDEIVPAERMPLRYVCHTPCFRSEAGSYGKDTRGIIRQHQFEKVELIWITKPEDSYAALEQLVQHAETILQKLDLPYRVVTLCGGDVGFSAAKTYDLEVWLAGQKRYREISSCSNCEAFQARRMQARWRNPTTGKPELLHTLNGSGLAVGRTLVAIMENYQDEQGNIHIPEVLQPYMRGLRTIRLDSES